MGRPPAAIVLLGREPEQAEIGHIVERARDGLSGVLVVRGDAGIGKTCLLDAVAATATDFDVVRLVGIESEMHLGFAALHQLLMPFLDGIDALPSPQARALEAAFGINDGVAPAQFLVGLAALTLVTTAAATRRPLLIIVDDTQWLDQESADALGFLARRLYADRICMLVAMRDSIEDRRSFDGLPSLALAPLSDAASATLLDGAVPARLADHVRARLLAEAHGNPLALIEFGRELSPEQLGGAAPMPAPLAVGRRLERHFLRQVGDLPAPTQRLLLVAAAEPTGDTSFDLACQSRARLRRAGPRGGAGGGVGRARDRHRVSPSAHSLGRVPRRQPGRSVESPRRARGSERRPRPGPQSLAPGRGSTRSG